MKGLFNNFGKYNAATKAIVAYTGITWKEARKILKTINTRK